MNQTYGEIYAYFRQNQEAMDVEAATALSLDEANVIGAAATQSGLYHRWATIQAMAKFEMNRAEQAYENSESDARERLRIQLTEQLGKKPPEDQIKQRQILDGNYQRNRANYYEAKYLYERITAVVKAFEERGRMIVTMNARQCKEISST